MNKKGKIAVNYSIEKIKQLNNLNYGHSSMLLYGCDLYGINKCTILAIPKDIANREGIEVMGWIYARNGRITKNECRLLLDLLQRDLIREIYTEEIKIIENYDKKNKGCGLEYYLCDKFNAKHADKIDDITNKRDVYLTWIWILGTRKSTRGCQCKCSLNNSSTNINYK
jgi:hypothetical protein